MSKRSVESILETESEQIQKLRNIVLHSIEEEKLLADRLCLQDQAVVSFPGRVADSVAAFGGSWRFILSFTAILFCWIAVNLFVLSNPFDPYPFILLNLVLSSVAALQAPIIMMSQNRKEERDRERARNDYMVNMKAEIEIRNLHEKLDLLIADQMKSLFEIQKAQVELMQEIKAILTQETCIDYRSNI